jgi:nucleoid-associated protein YgaU
MALRVTRRNTTFVAPVDDAQYDSAAAEAALAAQESAADAAAAAEAAEAALAALLTALADYLPLAGGTMTGKIVLDGDPIADLDAATKAYVDANVGTSGWEAAVEAINQYDISMYMANLGSEADEQVFMFLADTPFTLESGRAYALVASTGGVDYDIQLNGVSIGVASFTAATNLGSVTLDGPTAIVAGDRVVLIGPNSVDGTLRNFTITLSGTM